MDKKPLTKKQIILIAVAVVLAGIAFVSVRVYYASPHLPPFDNSRIVLPPANPYTFSTSSPLVITRTIQQAKGMGTLVIYTGTLPAVGSCQTVNAQSPVYGKNPARFSFLISTVAATTTCTNANQPITFRAGFGEDSSGNSPTLSSVYVNGVKAIYTVKSN